MKNNHQNKTMNKIRCDWAGNDPDYIHYHDREWGVPVYDDHRLFEFLLLEGFQAGLSWITILKKRENFRRAFDGFDYKLIARYNEEKIQSLLENQGIIRNRLKVRAAVSNAQAFMKVQKEFGSFSAYLWNFVGGTVQVNHWQNIKEVPATTSMSDALSKDLKKRGFKFVGSTIVYSFLQACGMVNDHLVECFRHKEV